jgi:hypothetical protein
MLTTRDKRIFSVVAPASGSVVLSALKIFGGFDGSAQDDDPAVNLTTHRRKSLIAHGETSADQTSDRVYQIRLRSTRHLGRPGFHK